MGASGDEPAPSAREVGRSQVEKLGRIIRERRVQAELSLRDLAARTNVSNPYLSQIERGLHQPSVRVLKAIAGALNMSAEALMVQAGLLDEPADAMAAPSVAEAVRADPDLTDDQRAALLGGVPQLRRGEPQRRLNRVSRPDATNRPGRGFRAARRTGAGAWAATRATRDAQAADFLVVLAALVDFVALAAVAGCSLAVSSSTKGSLATSEVTSVDDRSTTSAGVGSEDGYDTSGSRSSTRATPLWTYVVTDSATADAVDVTVPATDLATEVTDEVTELVSVMCSL